MNRIEKLLKALRFPHIVIILLFIPLSSVLLTYSMLYLGTESIFSYISYIISAYTFAVFCVRIPSIIAFAKKFKIENKYVQLWFEDARLRVRISLYVTLCFNIAYALLQLGLGITHGSFWFYSVAGYYISLAVMRFFLVQYTRTHKPGEKMSAEFRKYRVCGWIFLLLNIALSTMIFFMVYWNRSFEHHEITTIAMAAYTFTAFTTAIINLVRYRKYNSPVFSASKAISMASAGVSMLTLTSTMLTTFGETDGVLFRRIMLGSLGCAVSVSIITMAIFMIMKSTKKIKELKSEDMHE